MSYRYGSPQDAQQKPACWGNMQYHNPNTRECSSCYFQTTCRDQIVRTRNAQPPVTAVAPPVAPYYQHPGQAPVQVSQQAPIQQRQPQPVVPQQQSIFPAPPQYGYGWLTDPMYYTMAASPAPMVPQLGGESFWERLFKNIVISGVQSATWQLHLGSRQWVWAPEQEPINIIPPQPPQQ